MSKKLKSDNIQENKNLNDKHDISDEFAENDKAFKELALNNAVVHYNFINLFVLAFLLLFCFVFFIAVSGSRSVDDNNMTLTFRNFMSGHYVQSLENKYNNQIPYPETMKALEQRFSLFYGIGNKVTDPLFNNEESVNNGRNIFDELSGDIHPEDDDENYRKENVITSSTADENGKTASTTKKSETEKKTTTSALPRKNNSSASTTTSGRVTTTNNDPPRVTVTVTEPYHPATTTTQPPQTTSENVTTPPITSEEQSSSSESETSEE